MRFAPSEFLPWLVAGEAAPSGAGKNSSARARTPVVRNALPLDFVMVVPFPLEGTRRLPAQPETGRRRRPFLESVNRQLVDRSATRLAGILVPAIAAVV